MNLSLSIITINLNNNAGLLKTIESVNKQTFIDREFLIIDGGSIDGSLNTIKLNQMHLQYWSSEPDKGIYQAMNKGIERATGDYCLFLNSGDWLADTTILQQVFDQNYREDILYCNSYLYYSDQKIELLTYPSSLSMRYFYIGTLGHQATLIKRELFKQFGNYSEKYRIYSDFDFWLKTIVMGSCSTHYIPLTLSYYDMQGVSSISSEWSKKEREIILTSYFPDAVLADYAYWRNWELDMPVLRWFKNVKVLYAMLILLYKIDKNLSRLFRRKNLYRI